MRVLPENDREFKVNVELTGREVQLIQRALQFVDAPIDSTLKAAEIELVGEFESILDDEGLDYLEQ